MGVIAFYLLTLPAAAKRCIFVYGTGERIEFCDPALLYAWPISYLLFSALITTSIWLFLKEREEPFRSKLDWLLRSRKINAAGWAIFILCGIGILIGKSADPTENNIGLVCLFGATSALVRVLVRDGHAAWIRLRKY